MNDGVQIGLAGMGGLILVHVLAPTRARQSWQSVFGILVVMTRKLAAVANSYQQQLRPRLDYILNSSGMEKHRQQRAVGTTVTMAVGIVAAVAELELLILTLIAMGMADKKPSILEYININAGDATALALFGGMFIMGVIVMDVTGYTHWLPLPLDNRPRRVAIGVFAGLLLAGGVATLNYFSDFRAMAVSLSPVVEASEEVAADDVGGDAYQTDSAALSLASYKQIYLYLAILQFASGIVCFSILPATVGLVVVLFLMIGAIVAWLVNTSCDLWEGLVTAVCGAVLSIIDVVTGIFSTVGTGLRKLIGVDDSPVQEEPQSSAGAVVATAGAEQPAAVPSFPPAVATPVPAAANHSGNSDPASQPGLATPLSWNPAVMSQNEQTLQADLTPVPGQHDPEQDARWDPLA